MRFARYVALGDSSTEGLDDPDGAGGFRGWADRLAERAAVLYANLAVRGKLARQIRDEQLAPALDLRPDLATVFAGSNDILLRRFDPAALEEDVAAMQRALAGAGAVVLTFTLPDLTRVMPFGRFLSGRVRAMNDALRRASAASGATLVDLGAQAVASDRRLWSEDRFHVNAEGHARIAAALARALGLPGTDDAWSAPLPPDPRGRLAYAWEDLRWCWRRLRPSAPEAPRLPKRPRLEPVRA